MKLALRRLQRRPSLQLLCRIAAAAMCIFDRDSTLETILRSSRGCFQRIGRKWNLRLSARVSNVRLRTLSYFIECKVHWNLEIGHFRLMWSHSETSFCKKNIYMCIRKCKLHKEHTIEKKYYNEVIIIILRIFFRKYFIVERFNLASCY